MAVSRRRRAARGSGCCEPTGTGQPDSRRRRSALRDTRLRPGGAPRLDQPRPLRPRRGCGESRDPRPRTSVRGPRFRNLVAGLRALERDTQHPERLIGRRRCPHEPTDGHPALDPAALGTSSGSSAPNGWAGSVRQRTRLNVGRHFGNPKEEWSRLWPRVSEVLTGQDNVLEGYSPDFEEEAERIAAQGEPCPRAASASPWTARWTPRFSAPWMAVGAGPPGSIWRCRRASAQQGSLRVALAGHAAPRAWSRTRDPSAADDVGRPMTPATASVRVGPPAEVACPPGIGGGRQGSSPSLDARTAR